MSTQGVYKSIVINQSRQLIWDFITDSKNWKQWYGYDLIDVIPDWREGAELVYEGGHKTTLKQFEPPELLQLGKAIVLRLSEIDSSSTEVEFGMKFIDDDPRHKARMKDIYSDTIDEILNRLKDKFG